MQPSETSGDFLDQWLAADPDVRAAMVADEMRKLDCAIEKGREAWAGVDTDEFLAELRGDYE